MRVNLTQLKKILPTQRNFLFSLMQRASQPRTQPARRGLPRRKQQRLLLPGPWLIQRTWRPWSQAAPWRRSGLWGGPLTSQATFSPRPPSSGRMMVLPPQVSKNKDALVVTMLSFKEEREYLYFSFLGKISSYTNISSLGAKLKNPVDKRQKLLNIVIKQKENYRASQTLSFFYFLFSCAHKIILTNNSLPLYLTDLARWSLNLYQKYEEKNPANQVLFGDGSVRGTEPSGSWHQLPVHFRLCSRSLLLLAAHK